MLNIVFPAAVSIRGAAKGFVVCACRERLLPDDYS